MTGPRSQNPRFVLTEAGVTSLWIEQAMATASNEVKNHALLKSPACRTIPLAVISHHWK